ncbi:MAG TPA: MFS transporter [Kofleriaceae bacterium]|nr:MFS transporter [Kofleriaceae bacterium]
MTMLDETDEVGRATRIRLFTLRTPQMRAFHAAWLAFFLCFFAWFGVAPLMSVIRGELHLDKAQIGNTIIASVAVTIVARLLVGWICDQIGPRLTYAGLLVLGSLPVMGIGLAHSYETFLLFRLGIGVIGASFVVTQYHATLMFAPSVVGTANATTAGWGNLGGGVTQLVMPLVFTGLLGLGLAPASAWRVAMVLAGVLCLACGVAYYFFTQDTPRGNLAELRAAGVLPPRAHHKGGFARAASDPRVWALFLIYGACFGIELTIDNVGALYFSDHFGMGVGAAGLLASSFGLMNVFGRALGGILGDRFGRKAGLRGRVRWLFATILVEGVLLMIFSQMTVMPLAIAMLVLFGLFVQMGCGATFAVVPFVNREALGSVSGIVGAGGNAGAMAAGFLFKGDVAWDTALLILGVVVAVSSFAAFAVRETAPAVEAPIEIAPALEQGVA